MVRSSAMALSAALTGVGGTLFAQYFLYLYLDLCDLA